MTDAGLTFDDLLALPPGGFALVRVGGDEPTTIWLRDLGRSDEDPSWPRYIVIWPKAQFWREDSVVYWMMPHATKGVDDVVLARRLARDVAAIFDLPLEVSLKRPSVVPR